jgi:hypothetical protein
MKQRFSASRFDRLMNPLSNKVVRILGAWFSASIPHHNVEAFMNAGLIPEERGGRFYLTVRPEYARRLRNRDSQTERVAPVPFPPEAQRRFRLPTGT